ncbi:MAG: LexA family protein [Aristaeellaceae bacterium]
MNRIKEIRKSKKLTQGELGALIGVSAAAVSQWEIGKANISYNFAADLAKKLSVSVDYLLGEADTFTGNEMQKPSGVRIPVVGAIRAGIPITAIEEIEDWEEIPDSMARTGDYIALRVRGASMEPKIFDGDVAIIRRQETVENGQIAAVLINGDEATIKQVKLSEAGIMLIAFNAEVYEPHFYTNQEIVDLPVRIYGRLVEVRRKF